MRSEPAVRPHGAAPRSLISELEEAIQRGSNDDRIQTLRRITDLFVTGAERFNEQQVAVFDDVINCLIEQIENRALVELSERLAPIDNAPIQVIRRLAHDDQIAVAGPVLTCSDRIELADLLAIAKTKSQAHLYAISARRQVEEPLTEVLVERGNIEVARNLAANEGAQFSDASLSNLTRRAEEDAALAERIAQRSDIPLQLFCTLLIRATEVVRQRLLAAARPEIHAEVSRIVTKASGEVAAEATPHRGYARALRSILLMHGAGKLGEADVAQFARDRQFEETAAALSVFCSIPIEVADQLMRNSSIEPLLILCKAAGFDWATARAVLKVRHDSRRLSEQILTEACGDFNRLSPFAAQKVLQFWRARQAPAEVE